MGSCLAMESRMGCAKSRTQAGGGVAVRVGRGVGEGVMVSVALGTEVCVGSVGLDENVREGAAILVKTGVCEAVSSSATAAGACFIRLNNRAIPADSRIRLIKP